MNMAEPIRTFHISIIIMPNLATILVTSSRVLKTTRDFCCGGSRRRAGISGRRFAGLPVRKVIRPTRFYAMVVQRLKDHRKMDDGVIWSAQADFLARLADWDEDLDPLWPLQRCERSALLAFNVPYFVSPSDGNEIRDATGVSIRTPATSGLDRGRARMEAFDEQGLAWQIEVVRLNTIRR